MRTKRRYRKYMTHAESLAAARSRRLRRRHRYLSACRTALQRTEEVRPLWPWIQILLERLGKKFSVPPWLICTNVSYGNFSVARRVFVEVLKRRVVFDRTQGIFVWAKPNSYRKVRAIGRFAVCAMAGVKDAGNLAYAFRKIPRQQVYNLASEVLATMPDEAQLAQPRTETPITVNLTEDEMVALTDDEIFGPDVTEELERQQQQQPEAGKMPLLRVMREIRSDHADAARPVE